MPTFSIPNIDDFILNLQTNNYSPETVYNYERDLKVFEQFLNELDIVFSKVDKTVVARYKAYLVSHDRKTAILASQQQKQLTSRSINRMLSSLRSFLKYLIEMDLPCPVPPEAVKLTKTERKHPRVAELNDLIRLIESPISIEKNKLIGLRNRAILEVLFSTGMRISELCSLNRDQIDQTGKIFITGKGRKQRFVYLTPRAQYWLERYLAKRKDNLPSLFLPTRGKNAPNPKKRISTNYLQAKIKSYRQKLGINVPTSAHSLRHGFATYLAEEGASPAAIQILLGHESLDTTTRYVHPSDKFAEETHKKYHPLAQPDEA
jgi:site-specific recombinase XerD